MSTKDFERSRATVVPLDVGPGSCASTVRARGLQERPMKSGTIREAAMQNRQVRRNSFNLRSSQSQRFYKQAKVSPTTLRSRLSTTHLLLQTGLLGQAVKMGAVRSYPFW